MVKRIITLTLSLIFLLVSVLPCGSVDIEEMQFINKPVVDILLALAEISGKSIIPDETVTGNATYYFTQMDFETALKLFLETYKMYYRKEGNIYYVSRINVNYDEEGNEVTIDASDVELKVLIDALSKAFGKSILYDPLPSQNISVHQHEGITPEKLLLIILKLLPDYELEVDADYFYIKHKPIEQQTVMPDTQIPGITGLVRVGDLYSINVQKVRLIDLLNDLFYKAGLEYLPITIPEKQIENMRFQDKTFEEMLHLILDPNNADFVVFNDVYYIFPIQNQNILKKLKVTVHIPFVYISAATFSTLLPANLLTGVSYKLDTKTNSIVLNGSIEEITPVQEFIESIDRPVTDKEYCVFTLNYLDVQEIKTYFPPEYEYEIPVIIPNTNSFILLLHPEKKIYFENYIAMIDKPLESVPIKLKYLKAEELLETLPPSVEEEDIIVTGDPSLIFIKGTPDKIAHFMEDLKSLDLPKPQIRYQLLVIQYQDSENLNWDAPSEGFRFKSSQGDTNSFSGNIGQLMSVDFDVVSSFGIQFALQLSLSLGTQEARVLADTTLLGMTEQEIKFQNTETTRYREFEVNEEGEATKTGVTREISTGLIFTITGWVSGDGMITMNVTATVSKQGSSSSDTDTLPTTSENVINTQVRTQSGEPVIIGGLMRHEEHVTESKIPLLGDIPLIGWIFKTSKQISEKSELVIYIVPHVEYNYEEEVEINIKLEELYEKFMQ
jgi:general secretion pathway protein D